MDQRRSQMMQWTLLRGLSYFFLTELAPESRWTMQEGSSFHGKTWSSKSRLPELLWWSTSSEQSTRVVTSGGRHCYQTLCCHHQLTGGGWRQKECMSPTGRRCHKHKNPAMSWTLVAARVVAESTTGARRLHFSAQASACVRENVPADSDKISHLLKH